MSKVIHKIYLDEYKIFTHCTHGVVDFNFGGECVLFFGEYGNKLILKVQGNTLLFYCCFTSTVNI